MKFMFTGDFPVWIAVLIFVVASGLTVFVYRRHRLHAPCSFILPFIRIVVFTLLVFIMLQPVLAKYTRKEYKGTTIIVLDNSESMSVRDKYNSADCLSMVGSLGLIPHESEKKYSDFLHEIANGTIENQKIIDAKLSEADNQEIKIAVEKLKAMSRFEILKAVLLKNNCNFIKTLKKKGKIEIFSLDEKIESDLPEDSIFKLEPTLASSPIAGALISSISSKREAPVSCVVLLSDGINNASRTFDEMRAKLDEKGIQLFLIGIGKEKEPPDVKVETLTVPASSFRIDNIKARAVIRRNGYENKMCGSILKIHLVKF